MIIGQIWLTWVIAALAGLLGLSVVVLAILNLRSRRPAHLGAVDGFLSDCPTTSNCVCTQATRARQRIAPIELTGSADDALAKLKKIIGGMTGAKITVEKDRYLHVECRSRLFRLIDDLEFLADPERGVIHCRSASRAGLYDFGVNRRRVEAIRRAIAADRSHTHG